MINHQSKKGKQNSIRRIFYGGLVVTLGLIGVAVISKRRFANIVQRHINTLQSDDERETAQQYTREEVVGLPAPVRAYFEEVLTDGQHLVRNVRLRQRGELRLGGVDAPWRPLTATQHFTTRPPGFVWDATIDVFPYLPARVVDLYEQGEGMLRARLFGVVPVASAGQTRR